MKLQPCSIRDKSGKLIDLSDYNSFDPHECFEVLSRIYRFGARMEFTVLQHLVLGLSMTDDLETKKAWILHEAFEYASGLDVPTPLKELFPWYKAAEDKYLKFVFDKHKLDYSRYGELVKPLDRLCYLVEENHFFHGKKDLRVSQSLFDNDPWAVESIYYDLFEVQK